MECHGCPGRQTEIPARAGRGNASLTPIQAQVLALVRILLRAPRIVCLDEATAAVDPHTAALMAKAMRAYLGHSTCLKVLCHGALRHLHPQSDRGWAASD